jgi:acyl-CoA synthetase (AMP-forming)/AMP-acid ligase II
MFPQWHPPSKRMRCLYEPLRLRARERANGPSAVTEAAVMAMAHDTWSERLLACVVLKPGLSAGPDELNAHLAKHFTRWQLPDAYEFIAEIPRTSTGKFWKAKLRELYARPPSRLEQHFE